MSLLLLLRTNHYGTPYASFWSDHFPRKSKGHSSHWNYHFPDTPGLTVPPTQPNAPDNFALILQANAQISYSWRTGLFKSYSGKERRSSTVDDPAIWIEGDVHLVGAQTRTMRAQLARRAAQGLPFLLGLPHEEIAIRSTSSGTTIAVYSTANVDWCNPGQRVYVVHQTLGAALGVIQSTTNDTITLDVAAGARGTRGARVMPAVAVYLDPQQSFARYATTDNVETMHVRARLANAGWVTSAVRAQLALSSVTVSGFLDGLVIQALDPGADGNDIDIQQSDDALVSAGEIDEDIGTQAVHIRYMGGVTTVAQYLTLLQGLTFTRLVGTASGDPTDILGSSDNEFASTVLSGGADATIAELGNGADITEWRGRPIWDRGLIANQPVGDSVHSMATVTDLGGLPLSASSASAPDWGRVVNAKGDLVGDWQWLMKMLDTLRGTWRGFWLSTSGYDLVFSASGTGTLTVSGDLLAWFPLQRSELEIKQADGTLSWVVIATWLDNGDGTFTLDIEDEDGDPVTLSASAVERISWLEVVRLETDEVKVAVAQGQWEVTLQGRAIQNVADRAASGDTFLDDESGVESSQPREGIEIVYGTTTIRVATGTRTITIDGEVYEPAVAGRDTVTATIESNASSGKISLPASHEFARRWTLGLNPPKNVTVTIRRQQPSGFEVIYIGNVLAMQPEGHIATFQTISIFERALARHLPTLRASRKCAHVLGDDNCGKDIEAMKVIATVAGYDGRIITVSTMDSNPTGWADGGRFVHVPSGEAMTTFQQIGNVVTLQRPFAGIANGDEVWIYPGCGKLVSICRDKFANVRRFGNAPQLPTKNPMRATGFGVISS